MPSTSFGDIDIAGRATVVGRLSSTPGSSVYTAISHADRQLDFLPFGKAEGRHLSAAGEELRTGVRLSRRRASRSKLCGCVNRPDARTTVIRELLKVLLQRAISPLRILEILLNRGKILLRRRHISSFQVPLQLIECLRDRITASSYARSRRTARTRSCAGA